MAEIPANLPVVGNEDKDCTDGGAPKAIQIPLNSTQGSPAAAIIDGDSDHNKAAPVEDAVVRFEPSDADNDTVTQRMEGDQQQQP